MNAPCFEKNPAAALLQGAATVFDLSGNGVFPAIRPGTLRGDALKLRRDVRAIGGDFITVLNSRRKPLKCGANG